MNKADIIGKLFDLIARKEICSVDDDDTVIGLGIILVQIGIVVIIKRIVGLRYDRRDHACEEDRCKYGYYEKRNLGQCLSHASSPPLLPN